MAQRPNTLGGITAENRGRRGNYHTHKFNYDSPFENGRLTNWGNRKGWDEYFEGKIFRAGKPGGGLIGPDDEKNHTGRGPRGYQRADNSIYEDVCETLSLSRDVDASDIEVEVKDGCIYLKGSVDSRNTKRMAELEIENISGVRDVQNLLTIRREEANAKE